jgi:hypothetical protein
VRFLHANLLATNLNHRENFEIPNNSGAFKIRNWCTIMSIIQKYHDFLVMNINSYRKIEFCE